MNHHTDMISLVRNPVERFLSELISACELVRIVDDLVAEDRLYGLDKHHSRLVDELHEALALYVPDEMTRREEPNMYIDVAELRHRAVQFIAELDQIDQAAGEA